MTSRLDLPSCPTQHLHNLKIRILFQPFLLKAHGVLDDDHMAWQIDPNRECRGTADNIDLSLKKSLFDDVTVRYIQSGVMEGNSGSQRLYVGLAQ